MLHVTCYSKHFPTLMRLTERARRLISKGHALSASFNLVGICDYVVEKWLFLEGIEKNRVILNYASCRHFDLFS